MSGRDNGGWNGGAPEQLENIEEPHDNDVLSGRGNFVNYHVGNEHYRALVKKHKVAYVAASKPEKPLYARMIVDEVRAMNPPGRFLKQDAGTKLWYDIGDKKAVDKTRQALREGAPELEKQIQVGHGEEAVHSVPFSTKQQLESHGVAADLYAASAAAAPAPPMVSGVGHRIVSSSGGMVAPLPHSSFQPGRLNQPYETMDPVLKTQLEMQALKARLHVMYPLHNLDQSNLTAAAPVSPSVLPAPSQTAYHEDNDNGKHNDGDVAPSHVLSQQFPPRDPRFTLRERSDSLELDHVFDKDHDDVNDRGATSKPEQTRHPWRKQGDNGNSRSMGMSFSLGEMTEASNLSAIFEDSLRISDVDDSGGKKATGSSSVPKAITNPLNLSGLDMMSISTLTDVPNAMDSALNISYSHVFDESDAALQGVDKPKGKK